MADKTPTGRGAALWALFALLAAVYLATGSGRLPTVQDASQFAVTESIVKRGALDTNAIAWVQWTTQAEEASGAFGPEGDVFSVQGPAPALLAVPFYLVGWLSGELPADLRLSMLQTASWLDAVVIALTAVLLARAALALGSSLRSAILAGAIFGVGAIAWPYVTGLAGEPLTGLAIVALLYALLRLWQTGAARYAVWVGVGAGLMVATTSPNAILLVPFGVGLLVAAAHRPVRRSLLGAFVAFVGRLVAFAVPLAAVIGLLALYNLARFGTVLGAGDPFGVGFDAGWLRGLSGLLLGLYRGLFQRVPPENLSLGWIWPGRVAWEAPALAAGVTLMAILTWWLARRRARGLARGAVVLALAGLLALAAVSARVYAARPEFGVEGQGYAAALSAIDAVEGQRSGRRGAGIVTIALDQYQVPMARYRGRLPIYGYALEPTPLHPETESVLWRALAEHGRLWLVTVGLPQADPANGVAAWLAREAFITDVRSLDDARLALFVTAPRLEPLDVRASLGDHIRLLGVRLSGDALRPGDALAVELTWLTDAAVGDLRGFVQLLAPDGRLVAQQDGVPGGGYAASPGWTPGIPVADRHGLRLPADLPLGEYTLVAGLYDAETGQRLPVTGSAGAAGGDFVRLGMVQLTTQP